MDERGTKPGGCKKMQENAIGFGHLRKLPALPMSAWYFLVLFGTFWYRFPGKKSERAGTPAGHGNLGHVTICDYL
jgi:hypothetical protein